MLNRNRYLSITILIYCCVLLPQTLAASPINNTVSIGKFSQNDLTDWEPHSFEGTTHYKLVQQDLRTVLQATSQGTASGMVKKQQIDLQKTPYLNWQWKVDHALYRLSETFKEGDDFAARVYVVVDGGIFFWNTLALNYVWSSGQTQNALWDNPFTANAKMIAVESGNRFKNQWRSEKRNVLEDLRKSFKRDFRFIDAIAIMTDTDNSGQSATAFYGDIYFSEK